MHAHLFFRSTMLAGVMLTHIAANAAAPVVDVYKSAACGCCAGWVKHLQNNGFAVRTHDVDSPADYRQKFGMPQALGSCHTATVDGYVIEGHVPSSDIRRLLASRVKALGLAVPSMPAGSPGMEGARRDPYDVLLVQASGSYTRYRHVEAK